MCEINRDILFINIYFNIYFTSSQWHQVASNNDMVLLSSCRFESQHVTYFTFLKFYFRKAHKPKLRNPSSSPDYSLSLSLSLPFCSPETLVHLQIMASLCLSLPFCSPDYDLSLSFSLPFCSPDYGLSLSLPFFFEVFFFLKLYKQKSPQTHAQKPQFISKLRPHCSLSLCSFVQSLHRFLSLNLNMSHPYSLFFHLGFNYCCLAFVLLNCFLFCLVLVFLLVSQGCQEQNSKASIFSIIPFGFQQVRE